ncbi:MAG: hypothetical protein JXA21_21940 [Anaerolineae bacterium]|nr:hypothetical protein [Anaerolineae bacterium]
MNESSLRMKGRIGGMKGGCAVVLILAVILVSVGIINLSVALKNPGAPQTLSIADLVNEPATSRYVTTSGFAFYDAGYEKTSDGKVTETYYFLVDAKTGTMVLVKHTSASTTGKISGETTVTGMTRTPESDLRKKMQEEMSTFKEEGFDITDALYIADGTKPPTMGGSLTFLGIGGVAALLSVISFFFPGTVFAPYPVNTSPPPLTQRPAVTASGVFQQLKRVEPTIELGRSKQRFSNSVANLILRGEQDLLVYIHRVVRTKTYGVTVSTQESDWGAFFNGENVQSVEAGKIYGWKDKWAMRIRYLSPKGKEESFFVIFKDELTLAGFVNLLKQARFPVAIQIYEE